MVSNDTRIFTNIDYNREGKQVDWLYIPHSVHRSAYGNICVPIAVIKNGKGPTVFLMAGNHGDEYEGQVALCKLIQKLEPIQVNGRVIILPAANLPAALAGLRVSPIDKGNLNRSFPGDPEGAPTQAIAHYIDNILFPITDFFLDIHSGGSSLDYVPFVSMQKSDNHNLDSRAMLAMKAFDAPIGLVWVHTVGIGFAASAAIRREIIALGGEFGGGGKLSVSGLRIVERGIQNLLSHSGVLPPNENGGLNHTSMTLLQVRNRDYFVLAPEEGLFEPFVELGDMVEAGHACGQVHFVDNPSRKPVPSFFRVTGMVICKRPNGRVSRGDTVAHLATEYTE
jgi:predicted deacylase